MPVFAFSAGSLGDLITMGDMVIRVATAIYDHKGPSRDYEEVLDELRSVCRILHCIKVNGGEALTPEAQFCFQQLKMEGSACAKTLKDFVSRRPPKQEGVWAKVSWALHGESETAILRRRLAAHRETLTLHWQSYTHQRSLDMMSATRTDIRRIVMDAIVFVDATGVRIPVHIALCSTFEALQYHIQGYYKHREALGHEYVERGNYELVHGEARQEITPAQWIDLATPDAVVEMSIIVHTAGQKSESGQHCPKCRKPTEVAKQWARCSCFTGLFQSQYEVVQQHGPAHEELDAKREEWRKFRLLKFILRWHRTEPLEEEPKESSKGRIEQVTGEQVKEEIREEIRLEMKEETHDELRQETRVEMKMEIKEEETSEKLRQEMKMGVKEEMKEDSKESESEDEPLPAQTPSRKNRAGLVPNARPGMSLPVRGLSMVGSSLVHDRSRSRR